MRHDRVALGALLLLVTIGMTGCLSGFSPRAQPCPVYEDFSGDDTILAIGDSVFAWRMRSCETVPDVAAITLGRTLRHKAVNGARITGGDDPIVEQFEEGEWDWVLLDGGGNDLKNECECGVDCSPVLDTLVSEDGTRGEIPELVDRIVAGGSRVALYGYFRIDERAFYGFGECLEELDVLHARQQKVASQRDGVFFIDAREVVSPEHDPDAYAFDNLHPSAEGARIVGAFIAKKIKEAEAEAE